MPTTPKFSLWKTNAYLNKKEKQPSSEDLPTCPLLVSMLVEAGQCSTDLV